MSEQIPVIPGGYAPPGLGEAAHSDLVAGIFRDYLSLKTPPLIPDLGFSVPNADEFSHVGLASLPEFPGVKETSSAYEAPHETSSPVAVSPVKELTLVESNPDRGSLNPPPIHSLSPGSLDQEGAAEAPSRPELPYGEPLGPSPNLKHNLGLSKPDKPTGLAGLAGFTESPSYYFLNEPFPQEGKVSAREGVAAPVAAFDVVAVRRDFPILSERVHGNKPLIFLDNAATTQKPKAVIDATSRFYEHDNSNIHRAAYELAERATAAFEGARDKVAQFLGARSANEIIFTRGTTEAINLVANTFGRRFIGKGDEIILTQLEHHANIVPWQLLAKQTGAVIRVIPINGRGELRLDEYVRLLGPRTKLVSVAHVSNSLGTVNPVEELIALAHARGVHVLVDGAQSTPHLPVNVQALDADFFVFSGHKVFGPTGIGALYAKSHLLEVLPPWQGGGHMIRDVTFERTVFQDAPEKFEAGTPDIAGAVGLGAAIDYLFGLGIPNIAAYEHSLLEYATAKLASVPGIRPIGTAAAKASVLSFVIPGIPNETIASHLDRQGVAVRAGHHCALPAIRHFGLESSVRPSLAFYNTKDDVDALASALHDLVGKHRP